MTIQSLSLKTTNSETMTATLLKGAAQIFGMAALTALASKAQFYLPISPVPITLQTMLVLISGAVLGSKKGALSQISLIAAGLAGTPVFSQPLPGNLVLAGPTGGYIMGFVLAAFVAGWIVENKKPKGVASLSFYLLLSSLFVFIPGVTWLSVFTGMDISKAVMLGFVPFIAGDIVKCIGAALFARGLLSLRR